MDSMLKPSREELRKRLRGKMGAMRSRRSKGTSSSEQPAPRPARKSHPMMLMRRFPAWMCEQISREIMEVPEFMILAKFSTADYPELAEGGAPVGSSLEVLLVKAHGAMYYEMSTHMLGFAHEIRNGRQLEMHPGRIIDVFDREVAKLNAVMQFSVNPDSLKYVHGDLHPAGIPGSFVRDRTPLAIAPGTEGIVVLTTRESQDAATAAAEGSK